MESGSSKIHEKKWFFSGGRIGRCELEVGVEMRVSAWPSHEVE